MAEVPAETEVKIGMRCVVCVCVWMTEVDRAQEGAKGQKKVKEKEVDRQKSIQVNTIQQRVNSCICAIYCILCKDLFKAVFGKQPPKHCWEIPDLKPGSISACSWRELRE